MPYQGQKATGESLISLEQSRIFQDFVGGIRAPDKVCVPTLLPTPFPEPTEKIKRILAIDGSIVTEKIKNGFPGAEASVVQIALVSIDLDKLDVHSHKDIIPPSAFNRMDRAATLQCVLPGCNVVKSDGTAPKAFFRQSIFEALQGTIQNGHETLLETFRAITLNRSTSFRCPEDSCDNVALDVCTGVWRCPCHRSISLYETDPLRFHERFNDAGSNGEPHGEVMRFLELMLLLNVLRYFSSFDAGLSILSSLAFVVDGPLGIFGQFAALLPYVRDELQRINDLCVSKTGKNILLFSLIKTGPFYDHFEKLDFDQERGPNSKFASRTLLLPDITYIHKAIVYRPADSKPWGSNTYFGRTALYKTKSNQRMVLNTPKVTPESLDPMDISLDAFPGIAEITNITDRLSTYLFDSGFIPIVRAHSHAAIPLKMGGEIIRSLFEK